MTQKKRGRPPSDIRGQRFGDIVALYPTEDRDTQGFVVWHCRCDCGAEMDISYKVLCYTNQVSCGCRKKAFFSTLHTYSVHVSNTSINSIKSAKVPKNSTTGYRGVYFTRGKYIARINFQKKPYYLGAYSNIQDAVKARRDAQEQLFDSTASFYKKWKRKAEADPQWAKENPMNIQVTQKEDKRFAITMLPQL